MLCWPGALELPRMTPCWTLWHARTRSVACPSAAAPPCSVVCNPITYACASQYGAWLWLSRGRSPFQTVGQSVSSPNTSSHSGNAPPCSSQDAVRRRNEASTRRRQAETERRKSAMMETLGLKVSADRGLQLQAGNL